MGLAENIKLARSNKSISQRELAEITRVTPAYIALLETGDRRNPSLEILQRISEALEISVNKLIDEVK